MTVPQTLAITVPHASSQLALGRSACPDGASLTTVGSVLVDAVGTLTAQSAGHFTAQTNAAMSWLSALKTEAHTQVGFQIFAGGGTAPGACGSGAPADSPGASTPGKATEAAVSGALAAASLGRNVLEAASATTPLAFAAEVFGAAKNASDIAVAAGHDSQTASGVYDMESGAAALGGITTASSPVEALAAGLGAAATIASGAADAGGGKTNIEERAVNEIKMAAGSKITALAGVAFDYKTLNKFSVTAGALTSFTTVSWSAFCLLKFEVKAIKEVKAKAKLVNVTAGTSATMDAKATLTFDSPLIDYKSRLTVTKTLDVTQQTTLKNATKVSKNTEIIGNFMVEKDVTIHSTVVMKADFNAKKKATTKKKKTVKGSATQRGSSRLV